MKRFGKDYRRKPLWLAGVVTFLALCIVGGALKEYDRQLTKQASARTTAAAPSNPFAPPPVPSAGAFVDPYALGYKPQFIDPDDVDAGDPSTLLNLGVRYAYGLSGEPQDYVVAVKWLNLAASRFPASQVVDRDNAVRVRDDVQSKVTPAQIAEAERLAREWAPKAIAPPCKDGTQTCNPWERDWSHAKPPNVGAVITNEGTIIQPTTAKP